MSQYYVYLYLNPLEPGQFSTSFCSFLFKPFYVGKGKANRLFDHLKDARPSRKHKNSHKLNTIRTIQKNGMHPYIVKISKELSEDEALTLELSLILELKNQYGLTNIRTQTWKSSDSKKSNRKVFNSSRKDTITIYNLLLCEHAIIKASQLHVYEDIFGKSNIVNTTEIKFRVGSRIEKARNGTSNGMYGKSAVKGRKWCIVDDKEMFLTPEEIDNLKEIKHNVQYGRIYKPKGKRIIFEGEMKGKYRTDDDISANPATRYQYGLVWNNTKPTYINHKLL